MIEVYKIEDFVIDHLLKPYMSLIIREEFRNEVEERLRNVPEDIILVLDMNCATKQIVFDRLKRCGGVKWYRYLDMSNPVIRWVNENLEGSNE